MSNLKELIEEIKDVGELFNGTKNKDIKQSYNQYVEKIIMDDAEISQQDFLFKYWEDVKN